jgi:Crp-like helix-turn-helix protein
VAASGLCIHLGLCPSPRVQSPQDRIESKDARSGGTWFRKKLHRAESRAEVIPPSITQESLAQMVGATRSRVSRFINKFKELGSVAYGGAGLTVNSGLLSVLLHD